MANDKSKQIRNFNEKGTPLEADIPPAPSFFRMVVIDVISDPVAVTAELLSYYAMSGERLQYKNILPRNTLIAKFTNSTSDGLNPSTFLFPMLPPHISLPISPGEHVWAIFENDFEIGYWLCRIAEPWHVDDLNHTHPPRMREQTYAAKSKNAPEHRFDNAITTGVGEDRTEVPRSRYIDGGEKAYINLVQRGEEQINAINLVQAAAVPRYKKRPNDLVLEGKNNALIVIGTERRGAAAEYKKKSKKAIVAGTPQDIDIASPKLPDVDKPFGPMIDIVVGRGKTSKTSGKPAVNELGLPEIDKSIKASIDNKNEGDPDLVKDDSRIRLSQSIKIDEVLELKDLNSSFQISDNPSGEPGIVIKSDKIRIVARKDLEIVVASDGSKPDDYAAIIINAATGDIIFKPSKKGYIKLGSEKADKAILCTSVPATQTAGTVTSQPIQQPAAPVNMNTSTAQVTLGSNVGAAGTFAKKILVDS